jgi:hypothetical protein
MSPAGTAERVERHAEMKLLAVLAVAAAVGLGQGRMESPVPGRFEVWLPGGTYFSGMNVLLTDATGFVRDVNAGGHVRGGAPIASVPGRSDLIVVEWLSGSCDDYAQFALRPFGNRFELTVAMTSTPLHGGSFCNLLVGFSRSVTLSLSAPVAPESIALP